MGLTAEILQLDTVWRPAVCKHLLALSPDDRYGRFASALSDDGITAYVERIDFVRDLCFATLEPGGELSGVIHLAVSGLVAELGASVLLAWRHRGRARQLFTMGLRYAALAGIREVHLATGHPAARHICASLDYPMVAGTGYPRVRVLLGERAGKIGLGNERGSAAGANCAVAIPP